MSSAVRSSRQRLWAVAALAAVGMSHVTGLGAAQAVGESAQAAAAPAASSVTASPGEAQDVPGMAGRIEATVSTDRGAASTSTRSATGSATGTATGSTEAEAPMRAAASPGTLYVPMAPKRVLDTRKGTGAPLRQVAQGGSVVLDVASALRVAPGSIDSVVLNLTTTRATSPGYVSVCPASMPVSTCTASSSVSTYPGTNIAAMVVSKVDVAGRVRLYNYRGSLDLVADVNGYFDDSTVVPGDSYETSLGAERAFDTRLDLEGPLGPREYLTVDFFDPDPKKPGEKITSMVLNLTVTQATELTYYSVCPTSRALANMASCTGTSVVNAEAGRNTPNLVIVQLDENGEALFYNNRGTSHLIADVQGVFYDDQIGATYHPIDPTRVLDTRNGTGGVTLQKVSQGQGLKFVPSSSVLPADAEAIMSTVTATGVTAPSTYFSVCAGWTTTEACGGISNLNPKNDRVVSNMAASALSTPSDGIGALENELMIYNRSGETHMVMDLQGYFVRPPEIR